MIPRLCTPDSVRDDFAHMVQVYREDDKPLYRTGNKVLIALTVWSLALFILAKWYYIWRNQYVCSYFFISG